MGWLGTRVGPIVEGTLRVGAERRKDLQASKGMATSDVLGCQKVGLLLAAVVWWKVVGKAAGAG
jgi:hypothetical protein